MVTFTEEILNEELHFLCSDSEGASAAFLSDLSKTFDCLSHDLFITKLHTYGIKEESLNLLFPYLQNRQRNVRPNNTYSEL